MSIRIRPFTEEHVEAVRQFNDRLREGGATSRFSTSPTPAWLPKIAGRKLFQEYYLAVDDSAAVRGAYILKHQDFWIKDQVLSVGDIQQPISEGVVDSAYRHVGVQVLRDALARQPLLHGLGMGGYNEALPQVLQAARWTLFSVPFYFRVLHPTAFLGQMAPFRRSASRRRLCDALAQTGLGWLAVASVQAACGRVSRLDPMVAAEPVDEFGDWADELWHAHKAQYGISAVRDAETLRILYPKQASRFIRLKVVERSRTIGWAVLLNTQLAGHNHFGDMRLGSIADGFAALEDVAKVVGAAAVFLRAQDVDLMVSNQSHAAWGRGLRRAGFLRGPSNFIFASAPRLRSWKEITWSFRMWSDSVIPLW